MGFRFKILRSGAQLVLRQLVGFAIGFAGVLALSRTIGAESYGTFVAVLGINTYFFMLSQWGIGVYLVRKEGELRIEFCHQAFSLLLVFGAAATLIAYLMLPWLERWIEVDQFGVYATAMFLGLPVQTALVVPLARLERDLDFGRIAIAELTSQAAMYIVALPLAFQGLGVWAPVLGWWTQQVLLLIAVFQISEYRPRIFWNKSIASQILRYGLSFSFSSWIWQSRTLVNPLLISHYVGTAGVAYVALAIKFAEALSFARVASWRVSISALGRLQSDQRRFASSITEGMQLQVLAVGPLLVGFALFGSYLIGIVYGEPWMAVLDVYPYIALAYLAGSAFNMHSSALFVLGYGWGVTVFQTIRVGLFAISAILLVPSLGIVGYGWGELIALPSYIVIHWYLTKRVRSPDYTLSLTWTAAFGLALFYVSLGPISLVGIVAVILWPASWRALAQIVFDLRGAIKEWSHDRSSLP